MQGTVLNSKIQFLSFFYPSFILYFYPFATHKYRLHQSALVARLWPFCELAACYSYPLQGHGTERHVKKWGLLGSL
jgi:hypothetical protein